MSKERQCKC